MHRTGQFLLDDFEVIGDMQGSNDYPADAASIVNLQQDAGDGHEELAQANTKSPEVAGQDSSCLPPHVSTSLGPESSLNRPLGPAEEQGIACGAISPQGEEAGPGLLQADEARRISSLWVDIPSPNNYIQSTLETHGESQSQNAEGTLPHSRSRSTAARTALRQNICRLPPFHDAMTCLSFLECFKARSPRNPDHTTFKR